MFGLNPISIVSTIALGPAGGLVANLGTQMFTSIAQQFISGMGQQMGFSQSQTALALGDFQYSASQSSFFQASDGQFESRSMDDLIAQTGSQTNASPTEIAQLQRDADLQLANFLARSAESDEVKEARAGGGKGGAGNVGWLRAMAQVLGEKLDAVAHEMQDLAGKVNKEDPSTSTDFTVVSQEFNMLMNAVSTSLKTIGEAMGKVAARQ